MTGNISLSISVNSISAQDVTSSTKTVAAGVYDPVAQSTYPVDPPAFYLSSELSRQFTQLNDTATQWSGSMSINNSATDSLSFTARSMATHLHSLLSRIGMNPHDADASAQKFIRQYSKSANALSETALAFVDTNKSLSNLSLHATDINFVLRDGSKAMTVEYDNAAFSLLQSRTESLFAHSALPGAKFDAQSGEAFDAQASGLADGFKISTQGLSEQEAAKWLESLSETIFGQEAAASSGVDGSPPVSMTLSPSTKDGVAPGSQWTATLSAPVTAPSATGAGLNLSV